MQRCSGLRSSSLLTFSPILKTDEHPVGSTLNARCRLELLQPFFRKRFWKKEGGK